MQEPILRGRPSSPLSSQRSANFSYTKRLWLQLDVPTVRVSNDSFDELQYNQATYVDIDVRDLVDDVKTKLLSKLQNTLWVRFKDNTNISIGFYYHSSELLDSSQSEGDSTSNGGETLADKAFTLTYNEYQLLLKRNNLRSGRWSQLHQSINRLLHRNIPQNNDKDFSGSADIKYTYKVIIEPDQPIMNIYRELYGGLQQSEDALTVFYPVSQTHSSTPSEAMSQKELLDPIHIFSQEPSQEYPVITVDDELDHLSDESKKQENQGVLLLPKGFSTSDKEVIDTINLTRNVWPGQGDQSTLKLDTINISAEKPLIEEEVGLALSRTISSPEMPRPPSRKLTPALDRQGELPKYKVFPRINVLIVEDNAINQAILALFLKKNGISYKVAQNGLEAVEKWKEGDSHLILMDLQLPLLSGLEATKQIREMERMNGIGRFSHNSASSSKTQTETVSTEEAKDVCSIEAGNSDTTTADSENSLGESPKLDRTKFRSPVIIVALTASYAQSDRTEALLAGCNDYLTKPVNLDWLSKKLTEWGCMQALIDFDGWNEGQRRMTDTVVLKPQLNAARKSQSTSARSVPRVASTSSNTASNAI